VGNRAARGGLIAARAISTVSDYAITGVSCQENVRVLFIPARGEPCVRFGRGQRRPKAEAGQR
jgi:hypothetical protein